MKDGISNTTSMVPVVELELTYIFHTISINNVYTSQGQELLVIYYTNNQPMVSNDMVIPQDLELLVIPYAIN